tara:strand:+ start:194 stop:808 length:615 start_codon:yes stop_codon:yes gene_type:complete
MTTKKNVVSEQEVSQALITAGVALSDGLQNKAIADNAGDVVIARQDQLNEICQTLIKAGFSFGKLDWSYVDKATKKKKSHAKKKERNLDMVNKELSCPNRYGLLERALEGNVKLSFEYILRQVGKMANIVNNKEGKFTFHDPKPKADSKKVGMTISIDELIQNENHLGDFLDDKVLGALEALLEKKAKTQKEKAIVTKAANMYK